MSVIKKRTIWICSKRICSHHIVRSSLFEAIKDDPVCFAELLHWVSQRCPSLGATLSTESFYCVLLHLMVICRQIRAYCSFHDMVTNLFQGYLLVWLPQSFIKLKDDVQLLFVILEWFSRSWTIRTSASK